MGRIRDQADLNMTGPNVEQAASRCRATDGSMESSRLLFGEHTMYSPTAAKTVGKWYREVVEAAPCFMARWHGDEAGRSELDDVYYSTYGPRPRKQHGGTAPWTTLVLLRERHT